MFFFFSLQDTPVDDCSLSNSWDAFKLQMLIMVESLHFWFQTFLRINRFISNGRGSGNFLAAPSRLLLARLHSQINFSDFALLKKNIVYEPFFCFTNIFTTAVSRMWLYLFIGNVVKINFWFELFANPQNMSNTKISAIGVSNWARSTFRYSNCWKNLTWKELCLLILRRGSYDVFLFNKPCNLFLVTQVQTMSEKHENEPFIVQTKWPRPRGVNVLIDFQLNNCFTGWYPVVLLLMREQIVQMQIPLCLLHNKTQQVACRKAKKLSSDKRNQRWKKTMTLV